MANSQKFLKINHPIEKVVLLTHKIPKQNQIKTMKQLIKDKPSHRKNQKIAKNRISTFITKNRSQNKNRYSILQINCYGDMINNNKMKETIKNKVINQVKVNNYLVIMELIHSNLLKNCKKWNQMEIHKGFILGKIMINQLVYSIDLQMIKID